MKKIIGFSLLILFLMAACCPAHAQTPPVEKISVNVTDLTPEQILKTKADAETLAITQRIETYGKWAGSGKEVGIAVRDALMAVVEVADKFGKTNVGLFTMVMVAWKVMGEDVVRIIMGIVFALITTVFIFRSYHKNFTTRRIVTKTNGWKFWLPKEYEIVEPSTYDGYQFVKWVHFPMLILTYAITYALMFA